MNQTNPLSFMYSLLHLSSVVAFLNCITELVQIVQQKQYLFILRQPKRQIILFFRVHTSLV